MESVSFIMPFGKFSGKPVDVLPSEYLSWVVNKRVCMDQNSIQARFAAMAELRRRGIEPVYAGMNR